MKKSQNIMTMIVVYFATRVPDTSGTCAIPVRDKCDTSAMQVQHEQQECDTNDTIATQGENFDFDNNKSKNVLSHPYINYMANKRIK